MAKDFKNSIGRKRLNTLIPDNDYDAQVKVEEKREMLKEKKQTTTTSAPTPPSTVVTTFRINTEKLKTIKAIAFWDRKKIQDVFDEALEMYISAQPQEAVSKAIEEHTKRT